MSKLYHTESGHGIPTMGEEVTRFRKARKVLRLGPTSSPAMPYCLARAYPGAAAPPPPCPPPLRTPPPQLGAPARTGWGQVSRLPCFMGEEDAVASSSLGSAAGGLPGRSDSLERSRTRAPAPVPWGFSDRLLGPRDRPQPWIAARARSRRRRLGASTPVRRGG